MSEHNYPRTEEFLRYATANCGTSVESQEDFDAITPGSQLTVLALNPPQVAPERKLRVVRIAIDSIRSHGFETGQKSPEKPFEGVVTKSQHPLFKKGDGIIGFASHIGETLLVNTANHDDMEHLQATYTSPEYRRQLAA